VSVFVFPFDVFESIFVSVAVCCSTLQCGLLVLSHRQIRRVTHRIG